MTRIKRDEADENRAEEAEGGERAGDVAGPQPGEDGRADSEEDEADAIAVALQADEEPRQRLLD